MISHNCNFRLKSAHFEKNLHPSNNNFTGKLLFDAFGQESLKNPIVGPMHQKSRIPMFDLVLLRICAVWHCLQDADYVKLQNALGCGSCFYNNLNFELEIKPSRVRLLFCIFPYFAVFYSVFRRTKHYPLVSCFCLSHHQLQFFRPLSILTHCGLTRFPPPPETPKTAWGRWSTA